MKKVAAVTEARRGKVRRWCENSWMRTTRLFLNRILPDRMQDALMRRFSQANG